MDLYVTNELNANKYVAKSLAVMSLVGALLWLLNLVGIFIVDETLMNIGMPAGIFCLTMPFLLEKFYIREYHSYTKYLYLCSVIIGLGIISATLTIHAVLVWAMPMILSCHYYSGKLTVRVLAASLMVMTVAYFFGVYMGVWDNNVMRQVFSATAERHITPDILRRGLLFYVLPRSLTLCGMAPICYTLAGRTRSLIAKQSALTEEKNRVAADLNVRHKYSGICCHVPFRLFPREKIWILLL